jgi:hypothetical protein
MSIEIELEELDKLLDMFFWDDGIPMCVSDPDGLKEFLRKYCSTSAFTEAMT